MVFWRGCLHPYPDLSRDARYLSSLVCKELKRKTKEKFHFVGEHQGEIFGSHLELRVAWED